MQRYNPAKHDLKQSPDLISDIDECSKNSHNCSYTTATCTNTRGSFKYICKPGFSGDGHNCTGTKHYLEHDNLSYHRNKPTQLAEIVSLYIRWSYSGALSSLFPFSLGVRNHDHDYSVWFQFRHQWMCQWYPQLQQGQCHLFKHRGVAQLFLQSWIYWWWTHLPR